MYVYVSISVCTCMYLWHGWRGRWHRGGDRLGSLTVGRRSGHWRLVPNTPSAVRHAAIPTHAAIRVRITQADQSGRMVQDLNHPCRTGPPAGPGTHQWRAEVGTARGLAVPCHGGSVMPQAGLRLEHFVTRRALRASRSHSVQHKCKYSKGVKQN
jgi:hypothetical protein